jgi:hypothetical protein
LRKHDSLFGRPCVEEGLKIKMGNENWAETGIKKRSESAGTGREEKESKWQM